MIYPSKQIVTPPFPFPLVHHIHDIGNSLIRRFNSVIFIFCVNIKQNQEPPKRGVLLLTLKFTEVCFAQFAYRPRHLICSTWKINNNVTKMARSFQLNNGQKIPAIGFGTWKSEPQDAYNSVKAALDAGYRHIDTAFVRSYLAPATMVLLSSLENFY